MLEEIKTIGKTQRLAESEIQIRETEDKHLIKLIWSTGYKGIRSEWGEKFYEELDMTEDAIDLNRLNSGAPVLAQHESNVSAVIGVVERAWLENGLGYAEIRLSKRADVSGLVDDVIDGILRNVSVGYQVLEYTDITKRGESVKTLKATKWQPQEISIVAIGFDPYAQTLRSVDENLNEVKITTQNEVTMPENKELLPNGPTEGDVNKSLKEVEEQVLNKESNENVSAPAKSEEAPKQEIDTEELKRQAIQEYQTRSKEIKNAVSVAGLESNFADDFIERGLSVSDASKEIFKLLESKNQEQSNNVKEEKSMTKREMAEQALLNRIDAKRHKVDKNNPYTQTSFIKILEGVVERQTGESDSAFVKRATTTSDIADFLENVANKLMQDTSGMEKFGYHRFAGNQTLKDFNPTPIVQLSGVTLASKTEGGDYSKATLADSSESITLEERGVIVEISNKAIVNDDLKALKALPRLSQEAGHRDIEKRMHALLQSNSGNGPVMADTYNLFDSLNRSESNVLSAESPDVAGISEANKLMAAFTDDSGEPMDLRTKVILCGPDLEMTAKQAATSITAAKSGDVNPYAGEIEVVVSSRVPAGTWYAIADKDQYSALVYGTLEGQAEPTVSTQVDFNSSNHKVKIEYPNAAAAASYKGIIKATTT